MQMVRTKHWTLERDVGKKFFRVRRTAEPFGSPDELKVAFDRMERALHALDLTRYALLLDIREGPMRNDPQFERTVRPYQEAIMQRFGRVAILVKTPAGKLQANRIVQSIGAGTRVFDDERAAIAFLDGE
jgi:hypothetical protein